MANLARQCHSLIHNSTKLACSYAQCIHHRTDCKVCRNRTKNNVNIFNFGTLYSVLYPSEFYSFFPQNTGNRISETLDFKLFREACPRTAYECVVNVRPIGHPWLRHLTEQLTLRTTESLHPAPPPYPSLGNIYRNR